MYHDSATDARPPPRQPRMDRAVRGADARRVRIEFTPSTSTKNVETAEQTLRKHPAKCRRRPMTITAVAVKGRALSTFPSDEIRCSMNQVFNRRPHRPATGVPTGPLVHRSDGTRRLLAAQQERVRHPAIPSADNSCVPSNALQDGVLPLYIRLQPACDDAPRRSDAGGNTSGGRGPRHTRCMPTPAAGTSGPIRGPAAAMHAMA